VALAIALYVSSHVWARVWPLTASVLTFLRDETIGDDMWQGFNAIQRAEGKISREEVLRRLGEPDERFDQGSELPTHLADMYRVPQHEDGEGGFFIYWSSRPLAYCFIFFDAEGNVEQVATRVLD